MQAKRETSRFISALFPLNNSTENLADTAPTISASSYSDGPFTGTKAGKSAAGVYNLGSVWTVDFYVTWTATGAAVASFGTHYLTTSTFSSVPCWNWDGSARLNQTANAWYHMAFTCDGSKIRMYFNGELYKTTDDVVSNLTIASGGNYMSNIRILSKCLTTASSFPIPTDLYTGYESL